jgi:hypothetical protein
MLHRVGEWSALRIDAQKRLNYAMKSRNDARVVRERATDGVKREDWNQEQAWGDSSRIGSCETWAIWGCHWLSVPALQNMGNWWLGDREAASSVLRLAPRIGNST